MKIALASCSELPGWEVDDLPLHLALNERGATVEQPPWDAPDVRWEAFDAVLLRTTWDYMERREEFCAWAAAVSAQTRLFNPAEIIVWNTTKTYLRDLEAAGVPIAPTVWFNACEEVNVAKICRQRGWERGFIKPVVGATARETLRFAGDDSGFAQAQAHLNRTLAAEAMMLQPYLARVETEGEVSAIYIDGKVSHCVRKLPVKGDYRVQDDFGASDFPETLSSDALDVCHAAVAAIPADHAPLLYVRVDLLRTDDGRYVLTELEATEPSLFFRHSETAAATLAAALLARVRR